MIDRKRARVTTVFMDLQGCVATIVQQSFLSSDMTPRVSFLTLSLSVLVLVDNTSSPAHVGHFLQTGLQFFKTEVF